VTVCVSSSTAKLNNFWSGRCASRWRAVLDPATGSATLRGQLEVHVHYFEDGNVQLRTTHTASSAHPLSCPDAQAFANTVVAAIKRAEADYYAVLEVRSSSAHYPLSCRGADTLPPKSPSPGVL
jgi:capping protein alpha